MKEWLKKYYVFPLIFIILAIALMKSDKDIVNIIIGALVGTVTSYVIIPERKPTSSIK